MDNQLPQVELISSTAQGSLPAFPFSETLNSGVFVNATSNIAGIDINTIDVALLLLCPIFTTIGVLVSVLVSGNNHSSSGNAFKNFFGNAFANLANLLAGALLGVVMALFLMGAINNDISSLARVLVLSVFLGYKAPVLWSFQSKNKKSEPLDSNDKNERPTVPRAKQQTVASPKTKPVLATDSSAPTVALNQDALKQEKLKKARLKLAAKS